MVSFSFKLQSFGGLPCGCFEIVRTRLSYVIDVDCQDRKCGRATYVLFLRPIVGDLALFGE